jgi:broad specificity phosphatase PhoE
MTGRLLLVRHAVVDFDSRAFMRSTRGRQWDPPLGEAGLEQGRRLSSRLALMAAPRAVYVSPFQRCRQTLEPYLRAAPDALPAPIVEDDLGEVFIGSWEGMRFEDIVSGDEELARRFREQEAMFSMAPGGESGAELRARVVPVVERALDGLASETVLIVTHGGVINAFLGHVLGIPHDMFFLPDNASINTVEVDGDARSVRFLNDGRHLTDPRVFVPPTRGGAAAG